MKMLTRNYFSLLLAMALLTTAFAQPSRRPASTPPPASNTRPATQEQTTHSGNYAPGMDVVGRGYDIFDEFADPKSIKPTPIFEYSNFSDRLIGNRHYSVPQFVQFQNISQNISKTISGESSREYAQSLAMAVNLKVDALVFKGSISNNTMLGSEGSESRVFTTYMESNTKWRVSLSENVNDLRKIFTPSFRRDIESMDPATLFRTYGTHYIGSAFLGGRIDYNSVSTITNRTNRRDIETAVAAKYKAVSGDGKVDSKFEETLKNSNTRTTTRVTGGNSQFANNIVNNPANYERWADGIEGMPVLCDFPRDGLRPIWELASTPQRRQALEAEFEKLLAQNPLPAEAVQLANIGAMSKKYYLVNNMANTDLYLDLKGFNLIAEREGGRITMFEKDRRGTNRNLEGADRFMKLLYIDGHMYIQPQHSNLVFTMVSNGAGSQVQLSELKFAQNQRFKLLRDGNSFNIVSHNDLYLTSKGKNPVTLEAKNSQPNQQWGFEEADPFKMMAPPNTGVKFAIENKMAKRYIDMPGRGNGAVKKEAKLQLWDMDNDVDRYFMVDEAIDNAYVIQSAHNRNLVIDVEKGRNSNNGDQFHMWDRHNGPSQLVTFEWTGEPATYVIRSRVKNKVINASLSNINRNGCKIQLWDYRNEDNNYWIFHLAR